MKLEIRHLSVTLQKHQILKDLSLDVAEGEFLTLLGPSGCGKSTLLKAIAGIHPVSAGEILLSGQALTKVPPHKRGAVIVFQDIRLFPHMNVAENIAFPLKMNGVPKAERLKKASELLQHVQMEGYEHRQVTSLSGGEQQRIALARALAANPRLLLLDEPFSALDENLREDMRRLVKHLHESFGMTTVMVTHDRQEALSMSDRIALMFSGEIIECGTPKEVYYDPTHRLSADYFGDCAYLAGRVENGCFRADALCMGTDLPDGEYDLMLRSDALVPNPEGALKLKVISADFQGSQTLVTLREEHGAVWKKAFPAQQEWKIGDTVAFSADLSLGVLFPK